VVRIPYTGCLLRNRDLRLALFMEFYPGLEVVPSHGEAFGILKFLRGSFSSYWWPPWENF
jgi:hypothetical protein